MPVITFVGAGSTVFAKRVLGDVLVTPALADAEIRLVDLDGERLQDSKAMLENIARTTGARARFTAHAAADRAGAFRDADFVVLAIQVGGYEPATVLDFEIPKTYGIGQTIGDTLGIGGIMRGLRTIPVILDYCRSMERYCPDALVLNYVNPMAMVTGAILKATGMRAAGLCHSVQTCAANLCGMVGLPQDELKWEIAGINHQGWLLRIERHGEDLYPEIRRRAEEPENKAKDPVGLEIMKWFGHYVTVPTNHIAEYVPWFIKKGHPELLARFQIQLDEYPKKCQRQIEQWATMRGELVSDRPLEHKRTTEYASFIMEAVVTGRPTTFGGNVLNDRLIDNLLPGACVEVMCLADRNGVTPTRAGRLPAQCAAINNSNLNVHELTIEAALTGRKAAVYQAAMVDPRLGSELTLDEIVALVDELLDAHGAMIPPLR